MLQCILGAINEYNLYRPSFKREDTALRFVSIGKLTFKNKEYIFTEVQSVTASPHIHHVMLCNNLFLL